MRKEKRDERGVVCHINPTSMVFFSGVCRAAVIGVTVSLLANVLPSSREGFAVDLFSLLAIHPSIHSSHCVCVPPIPRKIICTRLLTTREPIHVPSTPPCTITCHETPRTQTRPPYFPGNKTKVETRPQSTHLPGSTSKTSFTLSKYTLTRFSSPFFAATLKTLLAPEVPDATPMAPGITEGVFLAEGAPLKMSKMSAGFLGLLLERKRGDEEGGSAVICGM